MENKNHYDIVLCNRSASQDREMKFRRSGIKEEDFLAHKLAQNNH